MYFVNELFGGYANELQDSLNGWMGVLHGDVVEYVFDYCEVLCPIADLSAVSIYSYVVQKVTKYEEHKCEGKYFNFHEKNRTRILPYFTSLSGKLVFRSTHTCISDELRVLSITVFEPNLLIPLESASERVCLTAHVSINFVAISLKHALVPLFFT
jgi:hypothetical protein